MKIAIVISSLSVGGAERVAAALANAWADRGWDVTIITMYGGGANRQALRSAVRQESLNLVADSPSFFHAVVANTRRVAALRRRIGAIQPDVVLGMMSESAVLTILACTGNHCRVIASERTYPPLIPIARPWARLRMLTYPRAASVVMQTSDGLKWLNKTIPKASGVVIPNPVSYPLTSTGRPLSVGDYIAINRRLLLGVGRLDSGKQFDHLIEEFASLAADHPDWDLVILGEGPERANLENLVREREVGNRASLPGTAGNMADWYERADLFAVTSRVEGFPNALLEALAYGCAAVSYDCDTGPRDLIETDRNGILVKPVGDRRKLRGALDQLMGDEAKRHALAERAMEVRDRYALDRIMDMWDRVVSSV